MPTDNNVLEAIGNTPLVKVNNLDTGCCELFVKMECLLPSGSLKDRSTLYMVNAAEKAGLIKQGCTLIESTSANTALALALIAAQRGYNVLVVVTEKISHEKNTYLKATGTKIVYTRSDLTRDHPDYYLNLAKRLACEIKNSCYLNQFGNQNNPLAYEETTAPEIWRQMNGSVDAIVCGVGTGGHLTGIGRYMKKVSPRTEMILADPEGSILAPFVRTGRFVNKGSWHVEGIGEDCVHSTCDLSLVKEAYTISDVESFKTARELLQKNGILAGLSSGTAVAAALRYCRKQQTPKRVVTFVYDSGLRYLSKLYNDAWLQKNDFNSLINEQKNIFEAKICQT